jgi:thymidylate kinase
MKRPIVIEFSGLPNSGKTTLLHNLQVICKSNNVKTIILQEPAELLPSIISKGSTEQNLWITLETLQMILEVSFMSDAKFILLDRGFYNQLFWATLYEEKNPEYSRFVLDLMTKFSEMYLVKPDYLYVIDVDVEEALRRRLNSGGEVTFSKRDFLLNYKAKFEQFAKSINPQLYIDTTKMSQEQVADSVFKTIITL